MLTRVTTQKEYADYTRKVSSTPAALLCGGAQRLPVGTVGTVGTAPATKQAARLAADERFAQLAETKLRKEFGLAPVAQLAAKLPVAPLTFVSVEASVADWVFLHNPSKRYIPALGSQIAKDSALTMDTQIIKRYSISEAGQVADRVAAATVFDRELSTMAANTRRARRADLATWATYLQAAHVDVDDCDFLTDPVCWAGTTAGLVAGFVQWMLTQGIAINSINRKLSTVKIFCRMAAHAHVIPGNDLALIDAIQQYQHRDGIELDKNRAVTRVGHKKQHSTELESEQVKALKNLPDDSPQAKRDRLMMCLMLDQALRVSEVVILTVADFNLRRRTMTFYRPKTNQTETHRLTDATLDALNDYLECDGAPQIGTLLVGSTQRGALTGEGMSERAVTKRVNYLAKTYLGIDNLSAHDLRHSAATRAARGGTSINSLLGLGGWTSTATAMRYVDKQKIANDGVKFED